MRKYADELKLKAVLAYINGEGSLKNISAIYEVGMTSLRGWVAAYREHGLLGLENRRKKRRTFSLEFKLHVIQRMEREGLSARQIAALYDLRKCSAVVQWKRSIEENSRKQKVKYELKKRNHMVKPEPKNKDGCLTKEQLIKEINKLRAENAYLKKLEALALS